MQFVETTWREEEYMAYSTSTTATPVGPVPVLGRVRVISENQREVVFRGQWFSAERFAVILAELGTGAAPSGVRVLRSRALPGSEEISMEEAKEAFSLQEVNPVCPSSA